MREPGEDNGMINLERKAAIQTMLRSGSAPVDPLKSLSQAELRKLRSEIDRLLPEDGVSGLDLEDELVQQYLKTKDLMDETLVSEDTPANQKAQVCNSVVTILAQLVKLQEDLRREQTLKIMESVLVEAIKTLPEATKDEFFAEYERMAAKAGLL